MGDQRTGPEDEDVLPGGITPEQPPMDEAAGGPDVNDDED